MTNTVTVVVPSYNRAHTLERALSSVLAQTHPANEIILVDDGSDDNTENFVRHSFPTIKYLRQDNQGVSAARNLGIRHAQGQWLAFLDSDDAWLPQKLEQQLAFINSNKDYKICHCDEIWIRKGVRVNPMKKHAKRGGDIFEHCLPLCAISPSAVMIHASLFDTFGLFDEQLPACEDYDLWLRLCSQQTVLYLDQQLVYKYGGHADQLSQLHWGMDRFRIQALEKILEQGLLTTQQTAAALKVLIKKLTILHGGARKRNNTELAKQCQEKLIRYQSNDKTTMDFSVA